MSTQTVIQLPPLTRRSMNDLTDKARRLGTTPAEYARTLIEDCLALQRDAEALSFAQIMKPV